MNKRVAYTENPGAMTCAGVFLLVSIWLFPSESFPMNTYRVGEEVTGKSYNEVIKAWHIRKFSMWVGMTDAGEEYVFFSGDTGLGDATVTIPYIEEEINAFEQFLVTAQEWGTIAKKNRADTDKALGCLPNAYFLMCQTDGTPRSENQMGLRFYARNDGQQCSLIIDMMDQRNQYKRATIYFSPSEMATLTKTAHEIGQAMSKAKETARKQHLFKIPPKDVPTP